MSLMRHDPFPVEGNLKGTDRFVVICCHEGGPEVEVLPWRVVRLTLSSIEQIEEKEVNSS